MKEVVPARPALSAPASLRPARPAPPRRCRSSHYSPRRPSSPAEISDIAGDYISLEDLVGAFGENSPVETRGTPGGCHAEPVSVPSPNPASPGPDLVPILLAEVRSLRQEVTELRDRVAKLEQRGSL